MSARRTPRPRPARQANSNLVDRVLERIVAKLKPSVYDTFNPYGFYEDVVKELRTYRGHQGRGPYTTDTFSDIIAGGENEDVYAVLAGRGNVADSSISLQLGVREAQLRLAAAVLVARHQRHTEVKAIYPSNSRVVGPLWRPLGQFVSFQSQILGVVDLWHNSHIGRVAAVWGNSDMAILEEPNVGESCDPLLIEAKRRVIARRKAQ